MVGGFEVVRTMRADVANAADKADAGAPDLPRRAHCPVSGNSLKSIPVSNNPKVAIKIANRIVFLDSAGLISVQAQGRHVTVHHRLGSFVSRASISIVEKQLEIYGLVRIHRSALVNRSWVSELKLHFGGKYRVLLKDGRELRSARPYKDNLSLLATTWL
jgi:DNA-binding LytR/AlgR family response regulator